MLDVFDDRRHCKPTQPAILVSGIDREVSDLALIHAVNKRNDPNRVSRFVDEGKRFPLTFSGSHVCLRENDKGDGLMIGHEP